MQDIPVAGTKGVMPGDPASRPKAVVIRTRRKPKGQQQLFAAIAIAAYLIQPGDTLSGIAASHGVSLAAVEAANPQLSDPNLIYTGQRIEIPSGSSASNESHVPYQHAGQDSGGGSTRVRDRVLPGDANVTIHSSSEGSRGFSSSSLSDIPGVPRSFAACVALRESTDLQNPAADGNAYGIISSSGYHVWGTSLAHQKHVFVELYQQYGGKPWAADGCPGT
jgi:LysM repeat protein